MPTERQQEALDARARAERLALAETVARQDAQRQSLRAEWLTYAHQIALAQQQWEANNVPDAWDHLEATRWDFRGWEHRYLVTLFNRNQRTFLGHTSIVTSVAFSPNGRRVVSGSWNGMLKVWDAQAGQDILTLTGHTHGITGVAFSPDGRHIASGSEDQTLKVWDAETGQHVLTLQGHTSRVTSVAFSSDGKRIASGSEDQTLKVWDAQTGQNTLTLNGHTETVSNVAFSPDSKRIISGSRDGTLKVWLQLSR